MVSFSSNCGFPLPTVNADGNVWGYELQTAIGMWDTLLGGSITLQSADAMSVTLSSSQAQVSRIRVQGALPTNFLLTFSAGNFAVGNYLVWNNSSDGFGSVVCLTTGGGAACAVPPGSMRSVNVDGVNAQFADNQSLAGLPAYVNKFRNPMMDVLQRGSPVVLQPGSGNGYTLDGWQVNYTSPTQIVVTQVYNGNLSGNALRISGPGAFNPVPSLSLQQNIESTIAAQLLGPASNAVQTITVRYDIYNNTSGTLIPQLATSYCNSRDNLSALTADLAAVNLQSCPVAAVTTLAYSFIPSSNIGNGYQVILSFGNAFDNNSGSVDISHCDFRVTSTAALGLNSKPPRVEARPYSEELDFCQRYFFKPPSGWWYLLWTAQNAGWIAGRNADFPEIMRAVPVMSGSAFNLTNCSISSPAGFSSAPVQTAGGHPFFITATAGGGGMIASWSSGSFSAELSS